MLFIKETPEQGANAVGRRLLVALKNGQKVLWLLSGGSNVQVEINTMSQLHGYEDRLTVMMADERYGPVGHADSNWQQLTLAGFDGGKATCIQILADGMTLDETAKRFAQTLTDCLEQADVVIGQFGIGDDGHIAGILPEAADKALQSSALAIGYSTSTFDRVTSTFALFPRLTVAYCFVYGVNKRRALQQLQSQKLELGRQPAQILREASESYIYNDYLEGESV